MIDDQSINSILDGILGNANTASPTGNTPPQNPPAAPQFTPIPKPDLPSMPTTTPPAPAAVPEPVMMPTPAPVVPQPVPTPFPKPPIELTSAPVPPAPAAVPPVAPVTMPTPQPVVASPVAPLPPTPTPTGNGPVYEGKGMGKYKVVVVPEKCIGAASCVAVAAKAFKLNDQQIAEVLPTVSQETDDNLLLAAQSCPTLAIEVYDTTTGEKVWPK